MAGHRCNDARGFPERHTGDAELIDFVESLSPRRRIRRPSLRRRTPPPAPPRSQRWQPAFVAVLAAVLAMGTGIALAATAAAAPAAVATVDCTLVVPADPLSATGLATPYRLLPPCHEDDSGMSAFVQATVIDAATGALSVYNPVVVDDGSQPAAAPVVPRLPANAVVGIWFGFNGDNLTLRGTAGSLNAARCVNGVTGSIFGQYAYCNAPAFFAAANQSIAAGRLTVPALGTAKDGRACPSTRDFGLVDMDQSDNVTATYLFLPDGSTAQNTGDNQAAFAAKGAKVQVNGSDNGLLDNFVMPALACTPFTAPDLADNGRPVTALALNELQAAAHQAAPVALVPVTDPMALVGGRGNAAKANLYRAGVDQPPVDTSTESPTEYCANLVGIGVVRTHLDRRLTAATKSPDPAAATNLFTFLAQRLSGSFDVLGCARLLHTGNPVHLVQDRNGVTTDARFVLPSPSPPSPAAPAPSHSAAAVPPPPPPTTPAAPRTTPPAAPPPAAQPPAQPAPAVPAAPPSASGAAPAAGDVPAGGAVPVLPVAASPAPTLTLGPMPAKIAHPAGAAPAERSMPPARLAGAVLLSGGGLVAAVILIRALVVARRRRYGFAGF